MQIDSPKSDLFVCRGCSCLCDDILKDDAGISLDANLCEKGRHFYQQPEVEPGFFVQDQSVPFEQALLAATSAINQATHPLICGLDGLSTQAQQAAWRLNDLIRGTIDIGFSDAGRGKMFAMQQVGSITGTLGEVTHRADVVLYWYADPAITHPRHWPRFAKPHQRDPKFVIAIDQQCHQTARQADFFLPLKPSQKTAALGVMRQGLRLLGDSSATITCDDLKRSEVWENLVKITADQIQQSTGHPISVWSQLLHHLVSAKYGAWFSGPSDGPADLDLQSLELARLIRELNDRTCFIHLSLRNDGNGQSAENVLAWSSGYPFAVNCSLGHPRFNGLEYSAASLLERGEPDLILLGSTEQLDHQWGDLSDRAIKSFQATPKIVLRETESAVLLDNVVAEFRVGKIGLSDSGDFCRLDGVSLHVAAIAENASLPSAQSILQELALRLPLPELGPSFSFQSID